MFRPPGQCRRQSLSSVRQQSLRVPAAGTKISSGLALARRLVVRDHLSATRVLLVSDLFGQRRRPEAAEVRAACLHAHARGRAPRAAGRAALAGDHEHVRGLPRRTPRRPFRPVAEPRHGGRPLGRVPGRIRRIPRRRSSRAGRERDRRAAPRVAGAAAVRRAVQLWPAIAVSAALVLALLAYGVLAAGRDMGSGTAPGLVARIGGALVGVKDQSELRRGRALFEQAAKPGLSPGAAFRRRGDCCCVARSGGRCAVRQPIVRAPRSCWRCSPSPTPPPTRGPRSGTWPSRGTGSRPRSGSTRATTPRSTTLELLLSLDRKRQQAQNEAAGRARSGTSRQVGSRTPGSGNPGSGY